MKKEIVEILSYTAGIVDGEGSICIDRAKRFWRVYIVNTYEPAVRWLTERVPHSRFVVVKSPNRKAKKPLYRCDIAGNAKVMAFLEVVLPYLIIKKERALTAITDVRHRYQLDVV